MKIKFLSSCFFSTSSLLHSLDTHHFVSLVSASTKASLTADGRARCGFLLLTAHFVEVDSSWELTHDQLEEYKQHLELWLGSEIGNEKQLIDIWRSSEMAEYYAKLTRKYLLNVVVHGFSKALKLGECTFMMIYLSNLLHFAKNIGFMTLHGGLIYIPQLI